ncbi:dynamin family protein [Actinomycetospora sp. NBRC 106378]|uniref:dynamin family protein n=1 Tax=Actinomycetospora sp. NBRC 106378 TaxID=3032208 RepID=UPI0024A0E328|nr:dynamin family protein [Actinomycetospora sp. NBRC 106378]GLZ53016.1 isoniazid-inducible protein iniA [Actinomycetospora sp. NBRC 106378]
MPSTPALDLIDLAKKATVAYQRPDLTARLDATRRRVADPDVRVLVVGEFKQGKSALVNALVSADVCPEDDDISTAVTTAVRYTAGAPSVTVVREAAGPADGQVRAERTDVPFSDLSRYVSEAGNPGNRERVSHVEVTVPRKLLSTGLVVVDTPGVGGLGSAHGAMTMAALPTADAVLLVSDCATEYTAPELRFLQQATALCPTVACVLTKTDLYPEWRRIADLDRGHLDRQGVRAPILPVSSVLRRAAAAANDAALNEESGFKAFVTYLREQVLAQSEQLDRRAASRDVLAVVEQISYRMRAELQAQQNPVEADRLIARLQDAKQRAEDLKKRSSRWQTTLNDGFGDLQSDIDHDLRDRMRALQKEAEETLEGDDPAVIWDQFAEWLHAAVAQAASTNFVWASQRAQHLSLVVADHFVAGGQVDLPDLSRDRAPGTGGHVAPMIRPEMAKFNLGSALITGMRGGQGGVMMFGLITSLAGMAMLNPITGAAAVLLGAKGVRDERKRLLERRRADAKQAVRRHVDDVTFAVGKDSRDLLRAVQRHLRDHFQEIAAQVSTSMAESVASAQAAVKTVTSEREERVRTLTTELDRLAALEKRAKALVGDD